MNRKIVLAVVVASYGMWSPTTSAGPVTSLDDIRFWVGSGEHRAALAIDWNDTTATDASLVWGYRFNGSATGEEMLRAVVEADPRLFVKLDSPIGGQRLFGVGYDLNYDGQFGITDGTIFDANGFAESAQSDGAIATDPADLYAEGWFSGFWHYGNASGNPYDDGEWVDGGGGMVSRSLADGDWDSWAFTPSFDFAAFAENPHAAEPPVEPLSADFDLNGHVDGDDFLIWQTGFGLTSETHSEGDANADANVDGDDFLIWQSQFGGGGAAQVARSDSEESDSFWPPNCWTRPLPVGGFYFLNQRPGGWRLSCCFFHGGNLETDLRGSMRERPYPPKKWH